MADRIKTISLGNIVAKALTLSDTIFIIIITTQLPLYTYICHIQWENLFTENDFDSFRWNHRRWFYTLKYSCELLPGTATRPKGKMCADDGRKMCRYKSRKQHSQWLVLGSYSSKKEIIKYTERSHSYRILFCLVVHLRRCVLIEYPYESILLRSAIAWIASYLPSVAIYLFIN